MGRATTFVGRAREMSVIGDSLRRAADGAGIGMRVVTVSPFGRDRPFGPMLDSLRLRWRDVVPSSPTTTVDYQLPNLPRFLMREAVIDAVERLAVAAPIALAIHDLHWADDDLVRRRRRTRQPGSSSPRPRR